LRGLFNFGHNDHKECLSQDFLSIFRYNGNFHKAVPRSRLGCQSVLMQLEENLADVIHSVFPAKAGTQNF
jgi:hypothetical protein